MTMTTFLGDGATTTTVAVAAALTDRRDVVVLEADPSGGSLAGWFDTPVVPSLSTVVAGQRGGHEHPAADWADIEPLIRTSRSGIRFVPAPVGSIEASRAIEEAERSVVPTLARHTTVLADVGRRTAADGVARSIALADAIVVCHREIFGAAPAAGVRLERLAELVDVLSRSPARLIVAVIGQGPFDLAEIDRFLADAADGRSIEVCPLADDPLAAAVLAGRQGVSARRFGKLPLVRSCRRLAASIVGDGDRSLAGDAAS